MTLLARSGLVLVAGLGAFGAQAQDLKTTRSANDFAVTRTKLVEAVKARGFAVVAEVDHSGAAKANGLDLRPTHLVIFGNPRGGTPLMNCNQTAGIDLPLKALVWQAADGSVHVSLNTPGLIATRHTLGTCGAMPLENMGKAMDAIAADATKP